MTPLPKAQHDAITARLAAVAASEGDHRPVVLDTFGLRLTPGDRVFVYRVGVGTVTGLSHTERDAVRFIREDDSMALPYSCPARRCTLLGA